MMSLHDSGLNVSVAIDGSDAPGCLIRWIPKRPGRPPGRFLSGNKQAHAGWTRALKKTGTEITTEGIKL